MGRWEAEVMVSLATEGDLCDFHLLPQQVAGFNINPGDQAQIPKSTS